MRIPFRNAFAGYSRFHSGRTPSNPLEPARCKEQSSNLHSQRASFRMAGRPTRRSGASTPTPTPTPTPNDNDNDNDNDKHPLHPASGIQHPAFLSPFPFPLPPGIPMPLPKCTFPLPTTLIASRPHTQRASLVTLIFPPSLLPSFPPSSLLPSFIPHSSPALRPSVPPARPVPSPTSTFRTQGSSAPEHSNRPTHIVRASSGRVVEWSCGRGGLGWVRWSRG
jgi:hypothetical protein